MGCRARVGEEGTSLLTHIDPKLFDKLPFHNLSHEGNFLYRTFGKKQLASKFDLEYCCAFLISKNFRGIPQYHFARVVFGPSDLQNTFDLLALDRPDRHVASA